MVESAPPLKVGRNSIRVVRKHGRKLPRIVLAAIIVHLVAAIALMPVSGQPFDLASLTGASEAWLRWGFPILYHWKFGFDVTGLALGAQSLRFVLEQLGMSGAAAIATAWKLPLVLADVVVGLTLLDLGVRLGMRRPELVPTLWLLSPVSLWVSAGHGQIESLTILAFVLSLDLLVRRRCFLAGIVVGLGIGIEFLPAVMVLVVGVWLYAALINRRQGAHFVAGLGVALVGCFGPSLFSSIGRSSLFSGLSSTAGVTTGSGSATGGQVAGGASLWGVFGVTPGHFWVIAAMLAGAGLIVVVAIKARKESSAIARQRLGVVAAGGLLLSIVVLDPGALPQFSDLALGGLCLIGIGVGLSPIVIVMGPLLQLAGGLLKVYGGTFQSYWYDMWIKSDNSGWAFPQSPLAANITGRLGALIIVTGLFWVLFRPAATANSPRRKAPKLRRSGNVVIGASAAVAILGSGFLATWSLQPTFWREVGSGGPASLADFASTTATRPGQVAGSEHGAVISFSPTLISASSQARVSPSMTLTVKAQPLFIATDAGKPLDASAATDIVTIPKWSARRADIRSVWVSVLLGRPDWVSQVAAGKAAPDLVEGTDPISPTAIRWLITGWSVMTYRVPASWISSEGTLHLSVTGTSPLDSHLVWNGASRSRWIVVELQSAESTVTIDGVPYHSLVTEPPPSVGYFNDAVASIQRLPVSASTIVTGVAVGGVPGTVVSAALEWPTSSPLDGAVPGFWLFELGVLDIVVLLAGALAMAVFATRRVILFPVRGLCLACNTEREIADPRPTLFKNGRLATRGTCPVCLANMVRIVKPVSMTALEPPAESSPPQNVSRKRVVLMTTRYPLDYPGGVERVAQALMTRLGGDEESWRSVHVSAYRGRSALARLPLFGDLVASVLLAGRTARRVDAVMVHGAEYAWGPLIVSRLARRPTVVVWHGVRAEESLPPARTGPAGFAQRLFSWGSDLLQRLALRADATVAVSPSVAQETRGRFDFAGHVTVIPNGVDQQSASARHRTRRQGDSPEAIAASPSTPAARALRVIWIGTAPYKKGLDIALAACERASASGQNLTLTVVGVSQDGAGLAGRAIPPWINWVGFVAPAEVDRILLVHDVLISPTRYEPFGMAVFEALAAGLPVIGSRVIRWQIGGAGEVVSSEDPALYSQALARLANPDLRRRLAYAAVGRARQFSWGLAIAAYLRLLDEVAPEPQPVARPVSRRPAFGARDDRS
ncbi:MAG: glycosyltransferase [Candidatus Dormiibacterota bacterium]